MPAPLELSSLDLSQLEAGAVTRAWVQVVHNAFGAPVRVPVMVAKGRKPGPVLGVCACLHGNEVQGVPAIHRLMHELAAHLDDLSGSVLGVLVANPYGYEEGSRGYVDSVDLNRIFPGHKSGNRSAQFVHHFLHNIVLKMNFLVDLHTASLGRANTLYVRADMSHPQCALMANAQMSKVILHTAGPDGSMRGVATQMGIPSICVEMGNASTFQPEFIDRTVHGLWRTMERLKLLPPKLELEPIDVEPPVMCSKSTWIYTQHGGLLHVHKKVSDRVAKGEVIASVVDIFGTVLAEYMSPSAGIVLGRSVNPVSVQGDRIIHLAALAPEGTVYTAPVAKSGDAPNSPAAGRMEGH